MAAIRGSKVVVKQGDGATPTEAFAAVAGGRNADYTLGGGESETTSWGDPTTTYIDNIPDFSISMQVVVKDKDTFNGLISDRFNSTIRTYQLEIEGFGTFEGPMIVTNISGSGQFSDAAMSSISLRASGTIAYAAAP